LKTALPRQAAIGETLTGAYLVAIAERQYCLNNEQNQLRLSAGFFLVNR
jgi:hypothetical protein